MNLPNWIISIVRFLLPGVIPSTPANATTPLGCFVVQEVCPNEHVKFFLYTNKSSDPVLLDMNHPENINSSSLVAAKSIKMILHGYNESYMTVPNSRIGPAYLENGDVVIAVGYEKLVAEISEIPGPCYPQATANLPTAGNCTAQLIYYLVKNLSIAVEKIHLIGFSLGAQAAGLAANYVPEVKLDRITGLDPAAPLYYGYAGSQRQLSRDDARFVDVVHTDAVEFGKLDPIGHSDFYVNGGSQQPGCSPLQPRCSHEMATTYWAESLSSTSGFWARSCPTLTDATGATPGCAAEYTNLMGEYTNRSMGGLFRVVTNDQAPYAMGKP